MRLISDVTSTHVTALGHVHVANQIRFKGVFVKPGLWTVLDWIHQGYDGLSPTLP